MSVEPCYDGGLGGRGWGLPSGEDCVVRLRCSVGAKGAGGVLAEMGVGCLAGDIGNERVIQVCVREDRKGYGYDACTPSLFPPTATF